MSSRVERAIPNNNVVAIVPGTFVACGCTCGTSSVLIDDAALGFAQTIFVEQPMTSSVHPIATSDMQRTGRMPVAVAVDVRRWTGRSAMTLATTTPLPRLATAGLANTRVSAMRPSVPDAARWTRGFAVAGTRQANVRMRSGRAETLGEA